ncbi:MAG: histidine triad nucleotide-binding protein [bacterium]|nr:histidine triad nucleotide-binding protein [bacterium]
MADCLFCKIVAKEIPATIVFENERLVAFEDIHPQAPTHVQIIPCKHIASTLEVEDEDRELVGEMVQVAAQLARERGFADDGYRLAFNTNPAAGQTVYHIHLHLLGGRSFGWPPG